MASAVNNDVARAASLIAVAVFPAVAGITGSAYLHPAEFSAGFHTAALIAASLCVLAGLLAAAAIRNPHEPAPEAGFHCAMDAPPMRRATMVTDRFGRPC